MLAQYSNRLYVIHLLLAAVVTMGLGLVSTLHAQETTYDAAFSSNVKEAIPINVLVGQSRVINFDRPIGRFSISNPEIAEAVMVRPDQVLVNGKAFGQINFIAWEKGSGQFLVFDQFPGNADAAAAADSRQRDDLLPGPAADAGRTRPAPDP